MPRTTRTLPLWVLGAAILLLAANLRIAVNSVGAVLPQMRTDIGLDGAAAGLLTALPPFCFGFAGIFGASIARRLGLGKTALVCAIGLTAGQVLRAWVPGMGWLFGGSILTLSAIAIANVILPSLAREFFPRHIASITTAYTIVMVGSAATSSFVTIPLQRGLDADFRMGLGMWAVAGVLAIIPWVVAMRQAPRAEPADGSARMPLRTLLRIPKAWILAVFFGTQSLQAYIIFGWYPTLLMDLGMSEGPAAAQVGVVLVASVFSAFLVPLVSRMRQPAILLWLLSAAYTAGYAGLLFDPLSATWLWSALIGVGQTFFPIALYVVNLRAATHAGVLTLSTFMQSVGYIIAGSALFLLGVIHGGSREWTGVLVFTVSLVVIQQASALVSIKPWHIEKELAARRAES